MRMHGWRAAAGMALLAATLAAGCGSDGPLSVSAIQVGRTRNADRTIGTPTFEFHPNDTMLAAVVTEGRGTGTLRAKWTLPGGMVSQSEQAVHSTQTRAVTAFELRSAGGFPPGRYTLEVFLDGQAAGTREMQVR